MSMPQATDRLRKSAIEPCVLMLLTGRSGYAHDVVTALGGVEGLATTEGTVYPMLSRLRREGLVSTEWQESPSGPPRRYYRLTPEGERAVEGFKTSWRTFRQAVDAVVAGDVALPATSTDPSTPLTVKEPS